MMKEGNIAAFVSSNVDLVTDNSGIYAFHDMDSWRENVKGFDL